MRKAAEVELQSAFASRLVHELRNPLAPIRMALHIMQLSDSDAGTLQAARVIIERQLGQLTRLIDDLDEVTQLRAGPMPLQKGSTTLRELLDCALQMARPQFENRQNVLRLSVSEGEGHVRADTLRLCRGIANVLVNASKYAPMGSQIDIDATVDSTTAFITISDHGIGVPAAQLEKIFDPFVQIDRTGNGVYDGLGIGLTLAKKIIQAHDGTIAISHREEGSGTRVSIRIPRDEQDEEVAHAPLPTGRQESRRLRILVADDNRDAAHTLSMMLNHDGHEVRMAHDGLETLAIGQIFSPELIFLDIGMPVLNGYETARQIRERPWGRNAYLVALTGWGHDSDRQAALENGFRDHIVKPAPIERLRAVVERAQHESDQPGGN